MAGNDRDRTRGALLGLAVGDALGAPLEGAAPAAGARAVERGLEMTGGGPRAPGEWTDDTAMALLLAESIAARGLLDSDVAARYIAWATTDGKGIGLAPAWALVGARDAEDARARGRAHLQATGLAAGNGTVMLATPIGLATRSIVRGRPRAWVIARGGDADTNAAVAGALLGFHAEPDRVATDEHYGGARS